MCVWFKEQRKRKTWIFSSQRIKGKKKDIINDISVSSFKKVIDFPLFKMTVSDTNASTFLIREIFGKYVLFVCPGSPWELNRKIKKSFFIRKQPMYILFYSNLFLFPQIHPTNYYEDMNKYLSMFFWPLYFCQIDI